jgi:hypothetical protein
MLGSIIQNVVATATWHPGLVHHYIYIYIYAHTHTYTHIRIHTHLFLVYLPLLQTVQTALGAHPASYSVGTGDSLSGDKVTGS